MLLKADIASVHDLFNGRIQYKIPVYQRHYVWTQEDHWIPLWQDIVERVKVNVGAETNDQRRPHFIGTIVTQQFITTVAAVPGFYVIDGQQRLTTVQIILAAITDVCASNNFEVSLSLSNEYLSNSGGKKGDEEYKIIPAQRDKSSFDALIDGTTISQGTIQETYQFFYRKIQDYLAGKDPGAAEIKWPGVPDPGGVPMHKMTQLLHSVLYDLKVVQIVIGADGDAENIFETINARGKTLNEFDHLRNNVFLKVRVSPEFRNGEVDMEELHKEHWMHFEDDFWMKKSDVDDGEILEAERFLQHFLMAKLKKDSVIPQDLFYTYDREYRAILAEDREVDFELLELKKYSKVYRIMVDCQYDPSDKNEFHSGRRMRLIAQRMQFYKHLKITSLHPFILFIVNELEISYNELERVFNILESYTMRRLLCSSQKIPNYGKLFTKVAISIGGTNWNSADLVKYLLTLKSGEKWPDDDDDVRNALARCGDDSFDRSITRYILYRIELSKEVSDITLRNQLEFSNKLTREHVMPKEWRRNWSLPESQASDIAKERDIAKYSIGNLTLLTEEANEELGNSEFSVKRGYLSENPDLKLTQEIVFESMNPMRERKTWDVKEIREREEKLWKCFCKELWTDLSSFMVWHLGELKAWFPSFTHGFIIDGEGQEIPVESSEFQHSDIPTLKKGTKVKFEKIPTEGGFKAVNVVKSV